MPSKHVQKVNQPRSGERNHLTITGQQYRGPLPPPSVLESYDKIYPGAAKIIIDNFISQSDHRRHLEKTVIQSGSRGSLLGIIFAFILGMTTIIGAVVCILSGEKNIGLSLGLVGLTSLVGTFIYGTRQKRMEREAKQRTINKIQPE